MTLRTGNESKKSMARRISLSALRVLLILGGIISILAVIFEPRIASRTTSARLSAAQVHLIIFSNAFAAFRRDVGYFPKGTKGLVELVERPRDAQGWKGPYLKGDIWPDPWGNPFRYESPGKNNASTYDLLSIGPDSREGTDDDITNWQKKN